MEIFIAVVKMRESMNLLRGMLATDVAMQIISSRRMNKMR